MSDQEKKAKNREYQQRYRLKQKSRIERKDNGKPEHKPPTLSRIDVMVDFEVNSTLNLLAKHYGTSKKAVLERLILQEWDNLTV